MQMIQTLTINFTGEDLVAAEPCSFWCRLAEDQTDEKLTLSAAAKIADELYHRTPCLPDDEQGPVPEVVSTDIEAIGSLLDLDLCAQLRSGDYTIKIRVIRSHPDIPYTPVITYGAATIKSIVPVSANVTYALDVESAEEETLLYPVVGDSPPRLTWTGVSGPEIARNCEKIKWEGVMTGRLMVSQATKYDLLTIIVPGVPSTPGSSRGTPQNFELTVFYNHQAYTGRYSSPNDYESISSVCGTWSFVIDEEPEEPEVPIEEPEEPEDPCQVSVIDHYNTSYKPGTEQFDLDKCCGIPPHMPTDCFVKKIGTVSAEGLSDEVRAAYTAISNYCALGLCTPVSAVKFVAIGPPPGETCGDVLEKMVVQDPHCCDGVVIMSIDYQMSIEVMTDNSTGLLRVRDGLGPYLWRVMSPGIFLTDPGGHKVLALETENNWAFVVSEDICGTVEVMVADQCSSIAIMSIRATDGKWAARYTDDSKQYWPSGKLGKGELLNIDGWKAVKTIGAVRYEQPVSFTYAAYFHENSCCVSEQPLCCDDINTYIDENACVKVLGGSYGPWDTHGIISFDVEGTAAEPLNYFGETDCGIMYEVVPGSSCPLGFLCYGRPIFKGYLMEGVKIYDWVC